MGHEVSRPYYPKVTVSPTRLVQTTLSGVTTHRLRTRPFQQQWHVPTLAPMVQTTPIMGSRPTHWELAFLAGNCTNGRRILWVKRPPMGSRPTHWELTQLAENCMKAHRVLWVKRPPSWGHDPLIGNLNEVK